MEVCGSMHDEFEQSSAGGETGEVAGVPPETRSAMAEAALSNLGLRRVPGAQAGGSFNS